MRGKPIIGTMLITAGAVFPADVWGRAASQGATATYDQAIVVDSPQRAARARMFNGYSKQLPVLHQTPSAGGTYPDSFARLERIPYELADLAVIADVGPGKAYLSQDQTTLYSEYSFKVTEVVANRSPKSVAAGTKLEVDRPGGVLRLPSGQFLIRGSKNESMPRQLHHYALLLRYAAAGDAWMLVSGYELNGDRVYTLESVREAPMVGKGLPDIGRGAVLPSTSQLNEYGVTEESFLNELRRAVIGK